MTQRDLERSVACATGEPEGAIRRRGFNLADPVDVHFDPEPSDLPRQWLDWDQVHGVRPLRPIRRRRRPGAA